MSTWITPSLFVGFAPCDTNVVVTRVDTPAEAVAVIRSGGSAWFETDEYDDLAEATLRGLGIDEAWISRQLKFARTGMLDGDPRIPVAPQT